MPKSLLSQEKTSLERGYRRQSGSSVSHVTDSDLQMRCDVRLGIDVNGGQRICHAPYRAGGDQSFGARHSPHRLKEMEAHGLVVRTVLSERPIAVEYSLTDQGKDALAVLRRLEKWTTSHGL